MCGIAGSFPIADRTSISASLARLTHRGPDAQRLIETPHGALAHSRLAIQDVANAHQPMARDGAWIAFNGEIYNYPKLMRLLPGPFATASDTEVILHLVQAIGPEAVSLLDGMFAFALLDGEDLLLARDPIGIKPLYYGFKEDRLYFASEVKALLGLAEDIHEFPAGHWWHSGRGLQPFYRLEVDTLFEPATPGAPGPDTYESIRAGLRAAVHKRMLADPSVAVGVSLSGGLDSSLIAALARAEQPDLLTFAAGMRGSSDLAMARRVARHLGTRHREVQYTLEEILKALPEIIYHLESYDAALVRSAVPNFFLARLASRHVKVMLTGEGADELYAGYDYLAPIDEPVRLQTELVTMTNSLHNTNLQRADRISMAFGLEARVPFLDKTFIQKSLRLPARWKLHAPDRPAKALLRQAFEGRLPGEALWRRKEKFSQGAGSMNLLAEVAQDAIDGAAFTRSQEQAGGGLKSKEEAYYYRIFRQQFNGAFPTRLVGRTRSVTAGEIA